MDPCIWQYRLCKVAVRVVDCIYLQNNCKKYFTTWKKRVILVYEMNTE